MLWEIAEGSHIPALAKNVATVLTLNDQYVRHDMNPKSSFWIGNLPLHLNCTTEISHDGKKMHMELYSHMWP